jgi:hypothetical protein
MYVEHIFLKVSLFKCKIWTRSKHDEIVDLMTKETCKEDKTPTSKGLVVKPIVSKEFNSRGQMELIDMQSLFSTNHMYSVATF